MALLKRPGKIMELRSGNFRCRMQRLPNGSGYRAFIFHYKDSGYADARMSFEVQHPIELLHLLQSLQQVMQAAAAELEDEASDR